MSDKLKNNFHTWNSYCADEGIERTALERGRGAVAVKIPPGVMDES